MSARQLLWAAPCQTRLYTIKFIRQIQKCRGRPLLPASLIFKVPHKRLLRISLSPDDNE